MFVSPPNKYRLILQQDPHTSVNPRRDRETHTHPKRAAPAASIMTDRVSHHAAFSHGGAMGTGPPTVNKGPVHTVVGVCPFFFFSCFFFFSTTHCVTTHRAAGSGEAHRSRRRLLREGPPWSPLPHPHPFVALLFGSAHEKTGS